MTSTPFATSASEVAPRWVPETIVCGVDGSLGSAEAVLQALTLASREGRIDFALVEWWSGSGAAVAPARADAALREAARTAGEAGVTAQARLVESRDAADALVGLSADADLLVVGTSSHSRAAGIALGRVATVAAHRSHCDVLLARRAPGDRPFPRDIVLAFDGSPSSERAALITAAIARRHDSRVTVAAIGDSTREQRAATARAMASLTDATGHEPVVVGRDGDAHARIVEFAASLEASLVVIGSRGLTGARALGSVSERVAHAAPCSVLIARRGVDR